MVRRGPIYEMIKSPRVVDVGFLRSNLQIDPLPPSFNVELMTQPEAFSSTLKLGGRGTRAIDWPGVMFCAPYQLFLSH